MEIYVNIYWRRSSDVLFTFRFVRGGVDRKEIILLAMVTLKVLGFSYEVSLYFLRVNFETIDGGGKHGECFLKENG